MKVVDLFAGCGGFSLGLSQAGLTIIAGVDNWPSAVEIYKLNFTHPSITQDLSDVAGTCKILKSYKFDLIAGGPPCQDYSSCGNRDINGGRADLTYSFSEIIIKQSPEFFIMENVERIRKSHILLDVIRDFASANYGLTAVLLDASFCGVPQARTRFFLIGKKNESHNFLLGTMKAMLAKKPLTMREYFNSSLGIDYYYRHPRNYSRRAIYSLDEPSATIRGVNRPIPPGYKIHSNDPAGVKLKDVRPLTTEERARVQTFPASFSWLGPRTAREQMIGNAVPVALAKFVGKALLEYKENGSIPYENEMLYDISDSLLLPTQTLDRGIRTMVQFNPEIKNKKLKSSTR